MADVEQAVIDRLTGAVGYGPELLDSTDPTSGWTQTNCSVVVNSGSEVHPEGAVVYDLSEDGTPNTSRGIFDSSIGSETLPAQTEYEFALDVKAANRDWTEIAFSSAGSAWNSSRRVWVDFGAGVFGSTIGNITGKSIEPLGSDWYRCRIRSRTDDSGLAICVCSIAEDDLDSTFDGLNQLSLYIANPSLREVKLAPRSELIRFNSEFDNSAVWTPVNASITPNTIAGPDGTTTADTLRENTTIEASHLVGSPYSFFARQVYNFKVAIKKANREWARVQFPFNAFGSAFVYFDVLRGELGSVGASVIPNSAQIISKGDDWFECSLAAQCLSDANSSVLIYIAEGNNDLTFSGLNQDSLYLWGAQVWENTGIPFDYMTDSGAAALVEDINLFRGPMLPAENNEGIIPRNAVFVQTTGGPEPLNLGRAGASPQEKEFNVQVLVRGEADKYGDTRKRAQAIHDTLHDQDPTGYIYMRATTPAPVYLGQVEHRAHVFVVNVRLGILE